MPKPLHLGQNGFVQSHHVDPTTPPTQNVNQKKGKRGSDELIEPVATALKQLASNIEEGQAELAVLEKRRIAAEQKLGSLEEEKAQLAARAAGVHAKKEEALAKKEEIKAKKAANNAKISALEATLKKTPTVEEMKARRAARLQAQGTPPQTPQNNLLQS